MELGAAALGSLLPDIDHPKSLVGRRLAWVSVPVAALVGHRGVTHSLLAVLACAAGLWFLGRELAWNAALLVGYLSHLAGDALTVSGIPLLWPWRRRFRSPLWFTTNGAVEWGLNAALLAGLWWARPEWLGKAWPVSWSLS